MVRVVVIGAGIGGLVLARALRDAGLDVRVHERDTDLAHTGGYRLHLDTRACAVLRRRLPPALYQALVASSAGPGAFRQFSVFDHTMRQLLTLPQDPTDEHLLIGRIPLRQLLAHDLGDIVRLDSRFVAHSSVPGQPVTAHFADGRTEPADVLVGADGARSQVVAGLAGRPGARTLLARGIAGRSPLTDAIRSALPQVLLSGPAFVAGPRGTAVFLSAHDPRTSAIAPDVCRDVAPILEPGYVLWGITTTVDTPRHWSAMDSARALLSGWSGEMRSLLDATDPADVTEFPYLAADPGSDLTPWPAGRVTALGDAVHAMPPTGGQGAATAILDADLLTKRLTEAYRGDSTPALAIHDFQREMSGYATAAIRESLQPLRWQRMLAPSPVFAVARRVLPVLSRVTGRLAGNR
ncbi:FAD-dependent oxidoreductase [Kibdelosporangium phytohabitans]|uniref:FAD-binding domain-containing protein n=1 Tax=Kibdelosporangium phytohabitans TaxID=860235 RepID=A0A0N9HWD5_9PSEU|nr:NAD(P)/FAD-dependent oxidoreductase [Kibdelosporangium phytohabitans]ALG09576.1 hypothetical protein AOZ06_24120 [Kibdelosporangium phytohabitans]MBE1469096.1 2-polyprenyl-6-methoxyphenol hydroxylase-like FAD-dependent oxidoreductase [Kibdelosporangium phytohabitans]